MSTFHQRLIDTVEPAMLYPTALYNAAAILAVAAGEAERMATCEGSKRIVKRLRAGVKHLKRKAERAST